MAASNNGAPLYAYNWFIQHGYSPAAAAGIVGNIHAESSFNPGASGDQGSAHGLFQVRGERWAGLQDYAKRNNLDPHSMDASLGYADEEMRLGKDPGAAHAFNALQDVKDPSQAAQIFMANYERPNADPRINNIAGRQSYANQIYGSDTTNVAVPANATTAASGGVGSITPPQAGTAAPAGGGVASLTPEQMAYQQVTGIPLSPTDSTGGLFGLMMSQQMKDAQAQANQPAPQVQMMSRPIDNRTMDQKMAAVSQTPNVYEDRIRQQQQGYS